MESHRSWRAIGLLLVLAACVVVAVPASAQWVTFVEQTNTRMVSSPAVGVDDVEEKDYAWGDVDKDGDVDLVVVRKQPFTTPGKKTNVLFLNENGVLTDRTADFADTALDVPGDQGFLTPTNDRDVVLADLNNDGWLDVVTATTISVGDPKSIGHPRVYMNLGCQGGCNGTADWLGFRFENARIPTMLTYNGQSGQNPCFCSVSAGDVTGDGYADLWFGDYDSGSSCSAQDFNDRLLVNQGASNPGFFDDVTQTRFTGNVPDGINAKFQVSAFGAANAIRDINGDGVNDLVKQTSLNPPQYVGNAYNPPANQGFFSTYDTWNQDAPYFVSVGELNNDNRLDMVITDDGDDRYILNQGGGFTPSFVDFVFEFAHNGATGPTTASDDGFGSDSVIADLNKDGFQDVLITDVDVDIGGCSRRMHIYRNLGGAPGSDVVLQEETTGPAGICQNFNSNPANCLVASIPSNMLEGTHDVAVFDINGDTWLDLVVGRCSGTEVYINVPPGPPVGATPDGGDVPGTQLTITRDGAGDLVLSWGESCILDDTDYSVYAGRLVTLHPAEGVEPSYSHGSILCSTGGATTTTLEPLQDDTYYLVVPNNDVFDGSYGKASSGVERPAGVPACHPQNMGECP
jgi:hypothetical protein